MVQRRNYNLYLAAKATLSLSAGIFGPFYILFVQQKGGGLENFGIAMGILAFTQALTSYFVGGLSDIHGRKPILITAGFLSALTTIAYLLINQQWQLFGLQALSGVLGGIEGTVGFSFLGDLTKKETRGADIGRFDATVGIVGAFAMILGGYIAKALGIESVFILMALGEILYASLLIFTREQQIT